MNLSFGFLWTMMAITRPETAAEAGRVASGLYAWADSSGRLVSAPPPGAWEELAAERTAEIELAMSTSSDGLSEVVLPSGAVAVELQGRFQHALFAQVGTDGAVRYDHRPAGAALDDTLAPAVSNRVPAGERP